MKATALIANRNDRWRKKLVALFGVPDGTSDAWLYFLASMRAAGGATKMVSTGAQDDPWRIGMCAVLRLPMSTGDKELHHALCVYLEARHHSGFGYEPLLNSFGGGQLVTHLVNGRPAYGGRTVSFFA